MFIELIRNTLENSIEKLREELLSYEAEEDIWAEQDGINNPGGTLVLHLCGNLQHYIGNRLGHTLYERNRPLEFSERTISKNDLLLELATTDRMISKVLNILNESDLVEEYPDPSFGKGVTIMEALLKLITHFDYHLGQINYHRRLLSKKPVNNE